MQRNILTNKIIRADMHFWRANINNNDHGKILMKWKSTRENK